MCSRLNVSIGSFSGFLLQLMLAFGILNHQYAYSQDPYFRSYDSTNGLAGNEVYEVIQDKKGYIWFCTNRGVSRFDGKKFVNFSNSNGLAENSILGLYEGKDGKIWCRGVSGTISYVENNEAHDIEARIPTYYANSLVTDDRNNLWVGSQSSGVYYKISPPYKKENLTTFTQESVRLQILRIGDDIIFSRSTSPEGVMIQDTSGKSLAESQFINQNPNLRAKYQDGIYRIVSDDSLITISSSRQVNKFHVPGKPHNVYYDGHLIWTLPSEMTGAVAVEPNNGVLKSWIFRDVNVSAVYKDREGAFWFCTLGSGVRYVPSLNAVKCNVSEERIPRLDKIHHASDKTFVSSINQDILVYTKQQFSRASDSEIEESELRRIFLSDPQKKNQDDLTYLGVFGKEDIVLHEVSSFHACNPLNCFLVDASTNAVIQYYAAPSRINAAIAIGKDSLLLGCNDGLSIFSDGNFSNPTFGKSLSGRRINDLTIDDEGYILAATSGQGIAAIQGTEVNWINAGNGLLSNQCESICFYEQLIYVGTNKGLSVLRKNANGKYHNIFHSAVFSLPNTAISDIEVSGENIWFATDRGIFKYTLSDQDVTSVPPLISVNEFSVNGHLKDHLTDHEFSHSENNIVINLASLSYLMPEQNRIRYKLSGANDQWESTDGGDIRFAALSPGEYEFSAIAENASGVQSNETIVIKFNIGKPLWLTWWFITFSAAFFVALFSVLIFFRLRKSNQLALEKETLKTKAAKMEMRALRSQMNPHFIFNSINSIQHYILNHDRLLAHKMLSSFAKLMRNVLENSASEFIPLNKEVETLNLYLKLEAERYESKFNYKIGVAEDIDGITTLVPPMIIQPLVENAIIHGIIQLKENTGELDVNFKLSGEFIHCIIQDNGIGRTRSAEIKKSKSTHHQSHGINITMERLHLCYKITGHVPEFDMRITDLINHNATPAGTKVEIMLPILRIT